MSALPSTESAALGVVVPIPKKPDVSIRARSIPAVVKPMVLAEPWNMPVEVSPAHEYPGVEAESALRARNWAPLWILPLVWIRPVACMVPATEFAVPTPRPPVMFVFPVVVKSPAIVEEDCAINPEVNVCNWLQLFAVVVPKASEMVFAVLMSGYVNESVLPPMQVPFTAKQPFARLIPPVEEKVEVAVLKLIPLVFPMERSEPGVVVPMPTDP
jgi:hypothetical protein